MFPLWQQYHSLAGSVSDFLWVAAVLAQILPSRRTRWAAPGGALASRAAQRSASAVSYTVIQLHPVRQPAHLGVGDSSPWPPRRALPRRRRSFGGDG